MKTMLHWSILGVLAGFLSCKFSGNEVGKNPSAPTDTLAPSTLGYYQIIGDSLVIPTVEIQLEISEKAAEKLKKDRETVIVDATFYGQPTDKTVLKEDDGMGLILAAKQYELAEDKRSVQLEGLKMAKSMYDQLADKDVELLINVFSGRRSTTDNLLDCGILQDKMSALKDKQFTLKCKLIEE